VTPRYLLDTNVLVHFVRDDATWQRLRTYSLFLRQPATAICVVTVGEIMSLARYLNWQSQRLSQVGFVLAHLDRSDIADPVVYQSYAAIDSHSRSGGKKMSKNDLWIAATANANGFRLLTTDHDFDHLAGTFVDLEYVPQGP
jgi:tRNA(fMet)-specific endonuclease VapC